MALSDKIVEALKAELASYPGRTSGALRDTLSMVIAVLAANILRTPGIALALALILLLQRERPGITLWNAAEIVGGGIFACAVSFAWVQLTDGTEIFRFLGVIVLVLSSGFMMASTRYPLFFTIAGFYGFVDMAAWDAHRPVNAIVTASLFNIATLALALGSAVAVSHLFHGQHPEEELHEELHSRIRLLARFYHELAGPRTPQRAELHHAVIKAAQSNDVRLNELYEAVRESTGKTPPGLHYRIGLLSRVLTRSSAIAFRDTSDQESYLAIARLCDSILDPSLPAPPLPANASQQIEDTYTELRDYSGPNAPETTPSVVEENLPDVFNISWLFLPDAFKTPAAIYYALKLTLSATVCYLIYNSIAWPGILTCVVTVLFTGLTSTGVMKQKQLYRITGASIGGALAILCESLLFPNMDSITALLMVIAAVGFCAAWISRSPRIGYIGVQIAFAFFLTVLPGFSAAGQLAPARDRVVGIALGILVMWFVFDQIWPTRPSDALSQILERIRRNTHALMEATANEVSILREEVSTDLVQMQALIASSIFDIGPDYSREQVRTRRLTRSIEAEAASFYAELEKIRRD